MIRVIALGVLVVWLAVQEWHERGVEKRIVVIDEEPPVRQPQSDGNKTLDDSCLASPYNRSPFQRVKKHVKQIITRQCL